MNYPPSSYADEGEFSYGLAIRWRHGYPATIFPRLVFIRLAEYLLTPFYSHDNDEEKCDSDYKFLHTITFFRD